MKKSIKDFDLNNKKVIIRCDFNVPMRDGIIDDDSRIISSLPTIEYALKQNAKIILLSHLGRVKTEEDKKKNNLKIVADRLKELLNKEILFIDETRGEKLEQAISSMQAKDVILIQNTRYEDLDEKKESSNDEQLGKYWASLGDIFINDAFGTIHRAHASNVGIASNIDSGIGLLVENELKQLSRLDKPEKPFVVILGGAKISDKIGVVKTLIEKANYILIGGGMAFTFLKAQGKNIGTSVVDNDSIDFAKEMLDKANDKIILPVDVRVTKEFNNECFNRLIDIDSISEDEMGLDIGPKTVEIFKSYLTDAKTIFMNGTLGYSEFSNYAQGTKDIMEEIININAISILGGGDTVAAANRFNVKDKVTHASTGGGATLEYIEGVDLPGLNCICDK